MRCPRQQFTRREPGVDKSDLFGTPDEQSLSLLNNTYKLARLLKGVNRASVEPDGPSREDLDLEALTSQQGLIEVRYFKLSAVAWAECVNKLPYIGRVEIQPRNGEITSRVGRLFFNVKNLPATVNNDNAIVLRVAYARGEDVPTLSRADS